MNKLNIILLGCFVILGFTIGRGQTSDLSSHRLTTITEYKTEIDVSATPFFSKVRWGKWLGFMPENLILKESWINGGLTNFSYELSDDKSNPWVKVYSDTLRQSIVQLPEDSLRFLPADGIAFLRELRKLFADSTRRYLEGNFTFGGDKLYASAVEIRIKPGPERRFLVRTYDEQGRTFIEGEVMVAKEDQVVVYTRITLFMYKTMLRLVLTKNKVEFQTN